MEHYNVTKVYCEMPPFIQTSAQSGAQAKLMHSCGVIAGLCIALGKKPCAFEYVNVNDWKGNLPKEVVMKRIVKIFNDHRLTCPPYAKDEWDAVGIGFYLKGLF
jgi:hypothetical protein